MFSTYGPAVQALGWRSFGLLLCAPWLANIIPF